ncbi:hypothetical protein BDZ94DRAFT_1246169 [Collybia nuda]|uniref:Uncharacterized protein n=1 Tax=Collybia nuda TaxID=64659 RepID=A0A9P5YJH4_9AGAR|nr:hypothetical protein BDZ94DRAFT_1246169 [Collybia nuda]
MPTSSSTEAATALWSLTDLPGSSLSHLKWSGDSDSAINSSFKLGVATQVDSVSNLTIGHAILSPRFCCRCRLELLDWPLQNSTNFVRV